MRSPGYLFAVVLAVLSLSSAPWWWSAAKGVVTGDPGGATATVVAGFSGGCPTYRVYAQNRWDPVGTAIRISPNALSTQVGSFPPNMVIAVNGWVHGRTGYATNTPPWDSDIWFHLSDGAGWVSFAGVRANPTKHDPTGTGDGGPPAATPRQCEGALQ